MDILFEIIMEIALEGIFAGSKSTRVPKPLRILFCVLLLLFFTAAFGLIFYAAFLLLGAGKLLAGILITALGLLLLVMGGVKGWRKYMRSKLR